MSFFIERSADKYGNRGLPAAVIEAEVIDEYTLRVLAPPTIAERWPTVSTRFLQQVLDEAGPARILTGDSVNNFAELDELLAKYSVVGIEQ